MGKFNYALMITGIILVITSLLFVQSQLIDTINISIPRTPVKAGYLHLDNVINARDIDGNLMKNQRSEDGTITIIYKCLVIRNIEGTTLETELNYKENNCAVIPIICDTADLNNCIDQQIREKQQILDNTAVSLISDVKYNDINLDVDIRIT